MRTLRFGCCTRVRHRRLALAFIDNDLLQLRVVILDIIIVVCESITCDMNHECNARTLCETLKARSTARRPGLRNLAECHLPRHQ